MSRFRKTALKPDTAATATDHKQPQCARNRISLSVAEIKLVVEFHDSYCAWLAVRETGIDESSLYYRYRRAWHNLNKDTPAYRFCNRIGRRELGDKPPPTHTRRPAR